jgi:L-threonylcarbamoyladenylate synthase
MIQHVSERVRKAVDVLRNGGLVGLPTETVYGLGADARNPAAVARIFAAKQRPVDHPLIVHVGHAEQLRDWARDVPEDAWRLTQAFWPGPLTMILPRAAHVMDAVTGGQDTVALRMPDHAMALAVLVAFGDGVAAPSANRYGRVSPTSAAHVHEELGDAVDLILDGGPCTVGIESTIVDMTHGDLRVLRPGAISDADLRQVLGRSPRMGLDEDLGTRVRSPGMKTSHYAPRARLVLSTREQALHDVETWHVRGSRVGLLASQRLPNLPEDVRWLDLREDPAGQAHLLYQRLREADHMALEIVVAVMPVGDGLAHALRDRLQRAAGLGDLRADGC